MPTGVTVAADGRIFVNFPRWGDEVPYTVGEIRHGKIVPYPDAAINRFDPARPGTTLGNVQSVVVDPANRLWILDTAAPSFSAPMPGGAKLVAVDLSTNKVAKTIVLAPTTVLKTTYINDVRFDLRQAKAGIAYITDSSVSGPGAIIVVDLDAGNRHRSGAAPLQSAGRLPPCQEAAAMAAGRAVAWRQCFSSSAIRNASSSAWLAFSRGSQWV
ncbi:MAG: L-dopachrome tautomerase-related protein [Aliidongia sp.]